MNVYIYQAALWCEECGEKIRSELREAPGFEAPKDEDDEGTYDSDDFPKGPISDSGGKADTPQHCDGCALFLENDLTEEGRRGLHEMIVDRFARPRTPRAPIVKPENEEDPMREWIDFYDVSVEDLLDWSES